MKETDRNNDNTDIHYFWGGMVFFSARLLLEGAGYPSTQQPGPTPQMVFYMCCLAPF